MSDEHRERVLSLCRQIEYRPEWKLRVEQRLSGGDVFIQVASEDWSGRKWFVSHYATDSEVIQTAFKALLACEEHEARERFLFRGSRVLGPHLDLLQLAQLLKSGQLKESVR